MKKYVFCGSKVFTDNTLAVFKEMINQKVEGKYVWLCNSDIEINKAKEEYATFFAENTKVLFVKKNSLRGIINYIFSNYVFYTHGIFEWFPRIPWQKKVNLWHGMPLKKIGHYTKSNINFNFDYTLANGTIFIEPLSIAFGISKEQILKSGSPRNDLLFSESKFNFSEFFSNSNQTVIWMPTFRNDIYSNNKLKSSMDDSLSSLGILDIYEFDNFLDNIEINILIKLHPMDVLNESINAQNVNTVCKHIRVDTFNNRILPDNFYPVLSKTCALITDYSSIYFDYLLLEKPIGIFTVDENEYEKSRGFIKDVGNKISGYKIKNLLQLKKFLISLTYEDEVAEMKKDVVKQRNIFQTYDNTPKNTDVLLKKLNILK